MSKNRPKVNRTANANFSGHESEVRYKQKSLDARCHSISHSTQTMCCPHNTPAQWRPSGRTKHPHELFNFVACFILATVQNFRHHQPFLPLHHCSAFCAETWHNTTSSGTHHQQDLRQLHLSCGDYCGPCQCCHGIWSIGTAESLVSTDCKRRSLAVPFAAVGVLCTSRHRTHSKMSTSVAKNMWFVVVHDGRMFVVLGVDSGNNKLLLRILEEVMQRERSDKDDLGHFKLSIA